MVMLTDAKVISHLRVWSLLHCTCKYRGKYNFIRSKKNSGYEWKIVDGRRGFCELHMYAYDCELKCVS